VWGPRAWSENDWNNGSIIKFLQGSPFSFTSLWVWFYSFLFLLVLISFSPSLSFSTQSLFCLFYLFILYCWQSLSTPPSSLQPFLCPSFIFHTQMSCLISLLFFSSTYPTLWGSASYFYLATKVISLCEESGVKGHTLLLSFAHSPCSIHSMTFFQSSLPNPVLHVLKLSPLPVFSRRLWGLSFTFFWKIFIFSLSFLVSPPLLLLFPAILLYFLSLHFLLLQMKFTSQKRKGLLKLANMNSPVPTLYTHLN